MVADNTSVPIDGMTDLLDSVLLNNRCVSYWIGHANILFVGIGQEVLPRPIRIEGPNSKPRFLHLAQPPYEIESRFAD